MYGFTVYRHVFECDRCNWFDFLNMSYSITFDRHESMLALDCIAPD